MMKSLGINSLGINSLGISALKPKQSGMKQVLLSAIILGLGACSDNDNDTVVTPETPPAETFDYQVKVINLTNGQPISPPGAILHDASYHAWAIGEAASDALELMAEGGDASGLIASQSANPTFSSTAPIGPGGTQTFEISSSEDATKMYFTVAGMLVNTNDAFSGVTGVSLDGLAKGEMRAYNTHAYDAGTENNDEISSNFPGPAGGGEGFNATRDDLNPVVTLHGGIVSQDDGYAESALTEAHRFDNSVMRIEVTRL